MSSYGWVREMDEMLAAFNRQAMLSLVNIKGYFDQSSRPMTEEFRKYFLKVSNERYAIPNQFIQLLLNVVSVFNAHWIILRFSLATIYSKFEMIHVLGTGDIQFNFNCNQMQGPIGLFGQNHLNNNQLRSMSHTAIGRQSIPTEINAKPSTSSTMMNRQWNTGHVIGLSEFSIAFKYHLFHCRVFVSNFSIFICKRRC